MLNVPTLESLSLKVMTENLSRYILGCESTEDDRLRNNMFFLQLTYSKMLLDELHKNQLLKESHLDFLLNEYLQDIDIALIYFSSNKEKLKEKLISIGPTFVKLSCSKNYSYEKEYLEILTAVIPHAVNAQKISIPNICNDNLLKVIAFSCPHLTELNIQESSVSDQGLIALCGTSELSSQSSCKLINLDLTKVPVTCAGIAVILKEIPTLQEVIFNKVPSALYSIHKVDIDNNFLTNAKKYNLTSLDFTKYYLNPSLLLKLLPACAELCPFVKKLVVPISGQESLDLCILYPQLESFTVKRYDVLSSTEIDFNNFVAQKGKNLKSLSIEWSALSVPNLVENCVNLESLELGGVDDEQSDVKSSKVLKYLKELKLKYFIPDSIIELLNDSPNIKTLHLYIAKIEESILLDNLSKFPFNTSLKHLYIGFIEFNIHLIRQIILSCPFLETLILNECKNINYDDYIALKKLIKTSNLNVEFNCEYNEKICYF